MRQTSLVHKSLDYTNILIKLIIKVIHEILTCFDDVFMRNEVVQRRWPVLLNPVLLFHEKNLGVTHDNQLTMERSCLRYSYWMTFQGTIKTGINKSKNRRTKTT